MPDRFLRCYTKGDFVMKLQDMIKAYIGEGYDTVQAQARVSQDVVILNIAASPLKRNVTIKGGVVMHNLSHENRRATQDIDFDFVHYARTLSNRSYRQKLSRASKNWLDVDSETVLVQLEQFLENVLIKSKK